MDKKYLYLSLLPEALIASMLPPEQFGNYLAVGTKKRTRGQAMFFEVDIEKAGDNFPLHLIEEKCVPGPKGQPKRSKYLSIYRTLELLPLEALKNLYLATDDGKTLALEPSEYKLSDEDEGLHLYQQLIPVNPRIASQLNPIEFMKDVTDTSKPVSVPKLVFVELQLGELADDPLKGTSDDLPYLNMDHLRDCLLGLQAKPDKPSKTVIRFMLGDLLYRTCKNGFFVGDHNKTIFYKFPSVEELQDKHYSWWRSALIVGFNK
jgi:hypothetical protein